MIRLNTNISKAFNKQLVSKHTFTMKLQALILALDWLVYIFLLASAVYCIVVSNVIQNYANKTTDTYKSEIDAENIQMPEFLFCDYSNRIRQLTGSFETKYYLKEKVGFGWKKIEDIRIRNNEKCFLSICRLT